MQLIDEEIEKLVKKYGGKNEIVSGNLDLDLHWLAYVVVREFRNAKNAAEDVSYQPEDIKHG